MTRMRTAAIVAVAFGLLAGCGADPQRDSLPPLPELQAHVVAAADAGGGRAWDGVVEAVQQASLSAQTSGRVSEVAVDIDDRVARDQVLLRITAIEQQAGADTARAQLRAAEAAAAEAEQNHRRYAALAPSQYVSKAQVDQARAVRDSALAARDAARAQLAQAAQQTGYTVVRAPFAGIVSRREVEPGETVAPGQPLMTVHAPGALRIEVQVPQSEAAALRAAGAARVVLDDGRTVEAEAVTVYPSADPASHSTTVRIALPALDDPPVPGTTAKIVFPGVAAPGAAVPVQVPAAALVQRGEVSAVYVLHEGRAMLRQVRVGRRLGERVEIVAGLRAGETIAVDPVAAAQALAAQRRAAADA
ncbi:efflux RND transporter periplasmic adaptor subunit [Luteimonas sp. SJ-92]|uniref:Efflux RND transporter periplasmic adaptor subunit n=1 Tax=Luteimonas salinisoli TaxID=2752307 RepID=A0A853JHD0_9GAMM|nr:efflux RND transporter periplasmic adaptor subunit [Luteimonas salinisoli]NZA27850.1 efflux RND transporter periplasmic adaptor subunit [Luteimonas salinisoli]